MTAKGSRAMNTIARGLIGISGYAAVGKDEVAWILCEEYKYIKRAFAEKVRVVASYLNVYLPDVKMTYNEYIAACGSYESAKRKHPCMREYLVNIGHGARIGLWKTVWIDSLLPDKEGVLGYIRGSQCPLAPKLGHGKFGCELAMLVNAYLPSIEMTYSEAVEVGLEHEDEAETYFSRCKVVVMGLLEMKSVIRAIPSSSTELAEIFDVTSGWDVEEDDYDDFVISDVRYDNESYKIRKGCGGEVWMVVRPDVGPANETEADSIPRVKYDRLIYNDGSLEDLRVKVMQNFVNMKQGIKGTSNQGRIG